MTDTIESLVAKLASTHGAKVDYALLRLPSGTVVELQPGVAITEEVRAELNEMLTLPAGWVPSWVGP